MKERAPLVVFVYNRLEHVKNCIGSLARAKGAKDTELFIFSDGPKPGAEEAVEAVRKYIDSDEIRNEFKYVFIKKAEKNEGLANSIIAGVTEIIKKYGKCIVVEDDNIVVDDFLNYMNNAMNYYQDHSCVWSVGGFSLVAPEICQNDVYFLGRICSYAWGTWLNRWERVDWSVADYSNFRFNLSKRKKFNAFGTDRANMLDRQMMGEINSWAIRFDYAGFQEGCYTVYPKHTKVKNTGNDGSGTHFVKATDRLNVELTEYRESVVFTDDIRIDGNIVKDFCRHYGLRWQARLKRIILREIYYAKR